MSERPPSHPSIHIEVPKSASIRPDSAATNGLVLVLVLACCLFFGGMVFFLARSGPTVISLPAQQQQQPPSAVSVQLVPYTGGQLAMDVEALLCTAANQIGVGKTRYRGRYLEIAEGRGDLKSQDPTAKRYQWCGDYVTFCFAASGCEDGELLNRAAINGKWIPGDNIDRIQRYAAKRGLWSSDVKAVKRGSVYIIETYDQDGKPNGGHIGIVEHADGDNIITLDGNSFGGVVARNKRVFQSVLKGGLFRGSVDAALLPSCGKRKAPTLFQTESELVSDTYFAEGDPLPAEYWLWMIYSP